MPYDQNNQKYKSLKNNFSVRYSTWFIWLVAIILSFCPVMQSSKQMDSSLVCTWSLLIGYVPLYHLKLIFYRFLDNMLLLGRLLSLSKIRDYLLSLNQTNITLYGCNIIVEGIECMFVVIYCLIQRPKTEMFIF